MLEKTLFVAILAIIFAVSGFGQQAETPKEKIEKPCTEPQIIAERIAASQKAREIDFNGNTSGQRALLKNFLPPGADAWVVEIVTTGGFSGKGLPTLTITSTGEVFVAADSLLSDSQIHPTADRKLKTEVLQKISQIVNVPALNETVKNVSPTNEPGQKEIMFLCNDCYQTSITVVRRDAGGEIRFFSNREKNILFSSGDFNRIHQIITEDNGILN